MDNFTATEQAYKNGYDDGTKAEAKYLIEALKCLAVKNIVRRFYEDCPKAASPEAALGALIAIKAVVFPDDD